MGNIGDLADFDAATSRSSAKRVAGVVSKFCSMKRKLVTDIGFGGILQMPQINKTPRKFTVWLLSNLDLETKSIVVNGVCKVKLTEKSFEGVLGIPCGPKKLVGLETKIMEEKIDFIKLAIGSISTDPMETCSLKVAEDVVTMVYPDGMNKEQIDRFKVAFVVFVVGHFLVAKTRTNHGIEDYWGSLLNASEIHLHNFCSLVIDEILVSAKKVQHELRLKHTIKNVTGCTLGLQVLYLDSLNLSFFSLPPERLPRIALFDLVLLKRMINADQENSISYSNSDTSGNVSMIDTTTKKRVHFEGKHGNDAGSSKRHPGDHFFRTPQPAVSTYLTAYIRGSIEQKLTYGQVDALKWHNARMIHHVRKTKELLFEAERFRTNNEGFKSIVEVHMETLMANIFQANLSLSQKLHKHASASTETPEAESKGTSWLQDSSNYNSSRSECHSSVGGRSVYDSYNSTRQHTGGLLSPLVGKQLFRDNSSGSSKRIKQENEISSTSKSSSKIDVKNKCVPYVLNEDDITAIVEQGSALGYCASQKKEEPTIFSKLKCKQRCIAPNPWTSGAPRKVVTLQVRHDLYDWLQNNNLSTLRSNWIVHALPKYIELDGYLLKEVFIKRICFPAEAFDIALRRMVQLDRSMYGYGKKMCWRHIMESDFAMLVLGNMDPLESISIIYQFTTMFNDYDISECRMLIIPAFVHENWCAYYWDMEETKVHVLDPMSELGIHDSVEHIHRLNIAKIQESLAKVVDVLFEGWAVNWSKFKTTFVKPIISSPKRGNDGFLTLLCIQEYDGSKYVEAQDEESVEEFTKLVLYEMVSLEENYGKLPEGFIQTIS